MNVITRIKNNRIVRALYVNYKRTLGFHRRDFGYLAKDACVSTSCSILKPSNVYIYTSQVYDNCLISALNAKFI